jgi:RNA polymerase sigma-70 factor (ECF subfamily)
MRIGIPIGPWSIVEDFEIIKLVKNGDTKSFSFLVEKYHRNLLAFIYRTIRRPDIVEDIGQEVFLSAFQSLHNFDPGRGVPFSAWLFSIARNRCISEIRKMKIRPEEPLRDDIALSAANGNSGQQPEQEERKRALESALCVLDEPFRSTLINSIEGLTIDDIARKNGLPQNTVKTRLFRARAKLRKLLIANKEGHPS